MHREITQVIKFGKKKQNINNLQCDVNLSTFTHRHSEWCIMMMAMVCDCMQTSL